MNSKQLSDVLRQVDVKDLAKSSGISEKTIYRLRHEQHSPTLTTVNKLLDAAAKLGCKALAPARKVKAETSQ